MNPDFQNGRIGRYTTLVLHEALGVFGAEVLGRRCRAHELKQDFAVDWFV